MLKNDALCCMFLILAIDTLPKLELPLVVALLLGLSIRIAFNWGKNILKWQDAIIRLIYAFCIFYLMVLCGFKYQEAVYPVATIAILGFMSMEVVNQGEKMILYGMENYIKRFFDNLKAKE